MILTFLLCRFVGENEESDDEESEDGDEDDDNENDEEDAVDISEEGRSEPPDESLLKPYYKTNKNQKRPTIARAAEKLKRASPDLTSQQLHSMQIQLPVLESTKKGKLNLPISKEEKEEFNFGFSTRPKVPRTPIQ